MDIDAALTSIGEDLGFGGGEVSEGSPAADKPEESIQVEVESPETPVEQVVETPVESLKPTKAAPKTWKPDAIEHWANLPERVQDEILKREEDMFKGIEGYKGEAQIGKTFRQVMAPFEQAFKQYGIDPIQHSAKLMAAHYTLATGSDEQKSAIFAQLASEYGINLSNMPYIDPQTSALHSEVAQLKNKLAQYESNAVNSVRAQTEKDIEAFASDPANPYFNEVANDIAAIIRGGRATTLKEAYDLAVWMNPITRAKEQERLQNEANAKKQEEERKRTEEAKKTLDAKVSVKPRSANSGEKLGTMEDTMRKTLEAIKSRS